MRKIILTDVDGVLLDWVPGFEKWCAENKHPIKLPADTTVRKVWRRYGLNEQVGEQLVMDFNVSEAMKSLPPYRDSVDYVRKLAAEGWKFVTITSQSSVAQAQQYRIENLNTVFGPDIFIKHHILETSAPKDDVLAEYKDSGLYWIEDKWDNAVLGADMGLIPLVMRDETNAKYTDSRIKHFDNWIQIYKHISGNKTIPEYTFMDSLIGYSVG